MIMLTQHAHRVGVEVAHVVVAHLAQLLPKLQFLPSDTRTGDGHHAHTHARGLVSTARARAGAAARAADAAVAPACRVALGYSPAGQGRASLNP